MSNRRKTKMTAAHLRQLNEDWARAAALTAFALTPVTGDGYTPDAPERIATLPTAPLMPPGRFTGYIVNPRTAAFLEAHGAVRGRDFLVSEPLWAEQ